MTVVTSMEDSMRHEKDVQKTPVTVVSCQLYNVNTKQRYYLFCNTTK